MFNEIVKASKIITLTESTNRREKIQRNIDFLNLKNLEFYIVDRFYKNTKYVNQNKEYSKDELRKFMHLGLLNSNLEIINTFIDDNNILDTDYIGIFEDDCVFFNNFNEIFDKNINYLKENNINFDILNLGGLIQPDNNTNIAINDNLIKINTSSVYLTQAVIYKKSCLKYVYDQIFKDFNTCLTKWKLEYVIDHICSRIYPIFDSYVFYPPITYQMKSNSVLQSNENKFINPVLRNKKKILNNNVLKSFDTKLLNQCEML